MRINTELQEVWKSSISLSLAQGKALGAEDIAISEPCPLTGLEVMHVCDS